MALFLHRSALSSHIGLAADHRTSLKEHNLCHEFILPVCCFCSACVRAKWSSTCALPFPLAALPFPYALSVSSAQRVAGLDNLTGYKEMKDFVMSLQKPRYVGRVSNDPSYRLQRAN